MVIHLINPESTLAITGAIRGSSAKKMYDELGLKSLKSGRQRKISFFYNVLKGESPSHLFDTTPNSIMQRQNSYGKFGQYSLFLC